MNGTLNSATITACYESGVWVTADMHRARAWLQELTGYGTIAEATFGIDDTWGARTFDARTAETIADLLRGLCDEGIITSPVGAEPTLDALADEQHTDVSVRQLILLPGGHTIADSHTDLRYFLDGDTAVERALGAVRDIVYNANEILAKFFTTFTIPA